MAFMHAYGQCQCCREEGALWEYSTMHRRFWIFGPMVKVTIYLCDECGPKHMAQEGGK